MACGLSKHYTFYPSCIPLNLGHDGWVVKPTSIDALINTGIKLLANGSDVVIGQKHANIVDTKEYIKKHIFN